MSSEPGLIASQPSRTEPDGQKRDFLCTSFVTLLFLWKDGLEYRYRPKFSGTSLCIRTIRNYSLSVSSTPYESARRHTSKAPVDDVQTAQIEFRHALVEGSSGTCLGDRVPLDVSSMHVR
jgi:hypothetical protein